jgi:hypothetical protein
VRDPILQLGRRSGGDDASAADHRNSLAQLVGLKHVVRGQQDRLPGGPQQGDRLT